MKYILDKYSDIIANYDIIVWESEPTSYRFKARITFIDGSYLAVKDYLFPGSRKYAFHWEDEEGKRIIRWDNAPHWKNIGTYPHHRHEFGCVCFCGSFCRRYIGLYFKYFESLIFMIPDCKNQCNQINQRNQRFKAASGEYQ